MTTSWAVNRESTAVLCMDYQQDIVTKRRVGAFSTTDLETVLQAKQSSHLVLIGMATSGVVLSTVRWAADADYELTVLADGCADADDEVHRVLMQKVFPRQATVITAEAFVQALGLTEESQT
jgi:nicotinamidase-related amidase